MTRALIIVATIAAFASGAALACGACVEDRVAATYDHAVVAAAAARHQQVVFVAIDGPVSVEKIGARIVTAASKVRSVPIRTLRVSASPAAFSFALAATQEPEVAVSAFRKALGDSGARLTLVRIMRDGALAEPR